MARVLAALGGSPAGMALAAVATYTLLLLPMALSRHFDLSVFIIAGDTYVDQSQIGAPIALVRDSRGYDGQFFYRLALDPFSLQPTDHGITLDNSAKRSARIVYPLLAWMVSFGQARFVPAGLLLVNLAGLAAIAGSAAWLTRRLALPCWLPFAILAWPGWLITLTDDTAEITAAALLLTSLAFYLSGRLRSNALLAAAATLTRETTLPLFVGVFACQAYQAVTAPRPERSFARATLCGLALVPFGLWHEVAGFGQKLGGNPDLGWPMVGAAGALLADLDGSRTWSADPMVNLLARIFVVLTSCGLFVFCFAVALRLPRLMHRSDTSGLALGWGLTFGLMSLLTADSPWLDPHGYFRAFTEAYVVGCLLLAITLPAQAGSRVATSISTMAAVTVALLNWLWCLSVLP